MGVGQLLLRVGTLRAVLLPAVGDLLLRVLDLRQGVVVDVVVPLVGPLPGQVLHLVRQAVDLVVVGVGPGLRRVRDGQIDLVVGLKVKALLRQIDEGGHTAAADGAGAPLVVEVVGGVHQSHQGVAVVGQQVQGVLVVVGGDRHLGAQVLLGEVPGVPQTLVGRLRHPARRQLRVVDSLGEGPGGDDHLLVPRLHEEVGIHRAPGPGDAVQGGEGRHVLLRVAQGGHKLEVKELILCHVVDPCGHHGGLTQPQPGKEANAQGDDRQDRQVAAQALADLPQGGFQQRPYHSISSTGTGEGLISSEMTAPFFTWITRSAMAVRALLWVMMMTVIPRWRLMSWRSFKMALPVL